MYPSLSFKQPGLAAEEIWAKAAELGTVIFVHPLGTAYLADQDFTQFNLAFVSGTQLLEIFAVTHLLFGGVLDRHSDLNICIAHGGGYLPYFMGRSDNCYESNPACQTMEQAPSDYLRLLHHDSRVFKHDTLRHLIDVAGASQIMLGTDYPYPVQNMDPTGFICSTPGLSVTEKAAILGGNATALYSL